MLQHNSMLFSQNISQAGKRSQSRDRARNSRFVTPVIYPRYQEEEDVQYSQNTKFTTGQSQNLQSQILKSLVESQQKMLEIEEQKLNLFRSSQNTSHSSVISPRMINNPDQQLLQLKIQTAAQSNLRKQPPPPTEREIVQSQLQNFEDQRAALLQSQQELQNQVRQNQHIAQEQQQQEEQQRQDVLASQSIAIQQSLNMMLEQQSQQLQQKDAQIYRLTLQLESLRDRLQAAQKPSEQMVNFSQSLVKLVFCFKKASKLVSKQLRFTRLNSQADDVQKLEAIAQYFQQVVDQLAAEIDVRDNEYLDLQHTTEELMHQNADLQYKLQLAQSAASAAQKELIRTKQEFFAHVADDDARESRLEQIYYTGPSAVAAERRRLSPQQIIAQSDCQLVRQRPAKPVRKNQSQAQVERSPEAPIRVVAYRPERALRRLDEFRERQRNRAGESGDETESNSREFHASGSPGSRSHRRGHRHEHRHKYRRRSPSPESDYSSESSSVESSDWDSGRRKNRRGHSRSRSRSHSRGRARPVEVAQVAREDRVLNVPLAEEPALPAQQSSVSLAQSALPTPPIQSTSALTAPQVPPAPPTAVASVPLAPPTLSPAPAPPAAPPVPQVVSVPATVPAPSSLPALPPPPPASATPGLVPAPPPPPAAPAASSAPPPAPAPQKGTPPAGGLGGLPPPPPPLPLNVQAPTDIPPPPPPPF